MPFADESKANGIIGGPFRQLHRRITWSSADCWYGCRHNSLAISVSPGYRTAHIRQVLRFGISARRSGSFRPVSPEQSACAVLSPPNGDLIQPAPRFASAAAQLLLMGQNFQAEVLLRVVRKVGAAGGSSILDGLLLPAIQSTRLPPYCCG